MCLSIILSRDSYNVYSFKRDCCRDLKCCLHLKIGLTRQKNGRGGGEVFDIIPEPMTGRVKLWISISYFFGGKKYLGSGHRAMWIQVPFILNLFTNHDN